MYVWKYRGRRDRRNNAADALETLDDHDLALLRQKELDIRAQEEVDRFVLEGREIEKFKNFVREDLATYFESRWGKDEVSAVGAELMDERAEKEKEEAAKRKANGEVDDAEDDDTHVSALSSNTMEKHEKKKKKRKKKKDADGGEGEGEQDTNDNNSDEASKETFLKTHVNENNDGRGSKSSRFRSEEKKEEIDVMSIEHILSLDPKELNKQQQMKLKVYHVFEMFDADAGGTIDKEEFRNCIDELCIPMDDGELDATMKDVDGDDSGEVEFEEFYGWYEKNSAAAMKGKMMGGMALKFAKAMRNYNGESVREEAKRLILACAEREMEEKTRKTFRRSRPPRFL